MRARTTLYLRGMPVDVVREAKAEAARRGCTIGAVVTDALERALARKPAAAGDDAAALGLDMAWYERHRASVVRKHPGEYVAIVGGALIDHDGSFEALAARVFERVGVRPVFMPRAEQGVSRVRVRSPRRVRG